MGIKRKKVAKGTNIKKDLSEDENWRGIETGRR